MRPALIGLSVLVLLMALGSLWSSRKIWLIISVVNNLALLLFFKYAGFLVENVNALVAWAHVAVTLPEPATLMPYGFTYLLPVGISFFAFQSLSYTIDFYLGNVPRERNFARFATFVCFFPQLMAGPIERAKHLLPQCQRFPEIRLQNFTRELERSTFYRQRVPKLAKQAGVFLFVCFAWIFFRAGSLSDAILIVQRIFTAPWHDPQVPVLMLLMVVFVWL